MCPPSGVPTGTRATSRANQSGMLLRWVSCIEETFDAAVPCLKHARRAAPAALETPSVQSSKYTLLKFRNPVRRRRRRRRGRGAPLFRPCTTAALAECKGLDTLLSHRGKCLRVALDPSGEWKREGEESLRPTSLLRATRNEAKATCVPAPLTRTLHTHSPSGITADPHQQCLCVCGGVLH